MIDVFWFSIIAWFLIAVLVFDAIRQILEEFEE